MSESNIYINNRRLYLADQISNDTIGIINSFLLNKIEEDNEHDWNTKHFKREPIKICISSPGGSVYSLLSTIDIIESSKTPIYTYGYGNMMSCAAILLMCGHQRSMTKRSTVCIHSVITAHQRSPLQTLIEDCDEAKRLDKIINDIILEKTDIPKSKLDKIKERKQDWYIGSDEALSLNIVDEIIL
jgi:ATP-dependent protease ClpP protease subunit